MIPPPGTPVTLHLTEHRRSLGHKVFDRMRGRVAGEPQGVAEQDARWLFLLNWVLRGMAVTLHDDPAMVEDAFVQLTLATGESKMLPPGKGASRS